MIYGKYDNEGNWKAYAKGISTGWASAITTAYPELAGKEVLESAEKSTGVYDILCNSGSTLFKYKDMYPFTKYRVDTNAMVLGTEAYFKGAQLTMPSALTSLNFIDESSLISTHYIDSAGHVEYSVNIRPHSLSVDDFAALAVTYGLSLGDQNIAAILVKWSEGVTPWGELYLYLEEPS